MAVVFEDKTGNKAEIIRELHDLWSQMYRILGIRLGLSNEALRFAATLRSHTVQNRLLSEEDSVELLRGRGADPRTVVETAQWLLSVTRAVDSVASMERLSHAITRISQARLFAAAIALRSQEWDCKDNERIRRSWESVTFRIYGMYKKDARTAVGSYVRLSWMIMNEELSADDVVDGLRSIGDDYPIEEALSELRATDCYSTRKEEVRYFLWKYDEFLSTKNRQRFTNEQWDRIWRSSASDTIEHILPQSTEREHVHWLGNLLLLPPRLNSELNDRTPKEKTSAYGETGLLIAQEVAGYSGRWSKRAILEREDYLLEWAKEEWR